MMDNCEVFYMIHKINEVCEYHELHDAMYHYMKCVISELADQHMFLDEIENLSGFNTHDQVVDYICEVYNDEVFMPSQAHVRDLNEEIAKLKNTIEWYKDIIIDLANERYELQCLLDNSHVDIKCNKESVSSHLRLY